VSPPSPGREGPGLLLGHLHGEHCALGRVLRREGAARHDAQRVVEGEHAGEHRGGIPAKGGTRQVASAEVESRRDKTLKRSNNDELELLLLLSWHLVFPTN
jgi:hypothetical protein